MIVNCDKYGGAGGEVPVSSTNEESAEIMLHEIGHSLAGLGDEYFAGDIYLREYPNLTQESDPSQVKWASRVGELGIGVYPLEQTTGWYIPHQSCKMKVLGQPFCAVCYDVLANAVYEGALD